MLIHVDAMNHVHLNVTGLFSCAVKKVFPSTVLLKVRRRLLDLNISHPFYKQVEGVKAAAAGISEAAFVIRGAKSRMEDGCLLMLSSFVIQRLAKQLLPFH